MGVYRIFFAKVRSKELKIVNILRAYLGCGNDLKFIIFAKSRNLKN